MTRLILTAKTGRESSVPFYLNPDHVTGIYPDGSNPEQCWIYTNAGESLHLDISADRLAKACADHIVDPRQETLF